MVPVGHVQWLPQTKEMWCGSRNKWEGMKGMKGMGLFVSAMLLKEQLSKNSAKKKISKAVSNQKHQIVT